MPASPRTVLVVDDNPMVRLSLAIALDADSDFAVAGVAGDGRTAIYLAEDTRPDVVVLDLRMPRVDGISALPQLRTLCPAALIVVFSSALHEAKTVCDLGADAFLDKAVPVEALLDSLREQVHRN